MAPAPTYGNANMFENYKPLNDGHILKFLRKLVFSERCYPF